MIVKGELKPGKHFDLHLIDLESGREVRRLSGHTGKVGALYKQ